MTHLERFIAEARNAGADVDAALANIQQGDMLWDEAIEAATIRPRLGLPPITVADAHHIDQLVNEAEAACEQAAAQIRTLLQQRDLLRVWNDDDAAFRPEFEATALTYHRLMRALLTLKEEQFSWEHRLRWMVEAQRYAALMGCWGFNASDVTCADLLTPGGKNALPVPQGSDWDVVLEHKHRWEDAIRTSRMAAAADLSLETN